MQKWEKLGLLAALLTAIVFLVFLLRVAVPWFRGDQHEQEKVTLRLNWLPDPTFTGPYLAKYSGLWEGGLEVDILPGGYELDPIKLVAAGTNDFGIAGADRVMLAVAKGVPIRAIAVEFQRNPVGWMVRVDSGIYSPKDFEGRRVAVKQEESFLIYQALLEKYDVVRSKIIEVPVSFQLEPFLAGQVDAFPVYMNEEPHRARDRKIDVRVLDPADFGVEVYGNVLFTRRELLEKKRSLVGRYVAGHLEGWKRAVAAPGEAARVLDQNVPEMDSATLRRVLDSTLELLFSNKQGDPSLIGTMSREGWERTKQFLVKYAQLKPDFDVTGVYDPSFVTP